MQKKLALAAAVIHGPKVLFLDEPFEGVDAIASGTLKAMLQGMIARGATIFLTSHVLEIVERLCSHIAIIDHGQLIANGSLEELRAGVRARNPDSNGTSSQTLTLEEIFLSIVGNEPGAQQPEQELSWLG
jgi:ABC-2 type transport system ATP-binding protein